MSAQHLLSELASQLGLTSLELDENRVCRLIFDKQMVVDMEVPEDESALQLFGIVGPLPVDGREPVYQQLLEFNMPTDEPSAPYGAVDVESAEVLLCQSVTLPTSVGTFSQLLEAFLNQLESWQEQLSSAGHAPPAAEPPQMPGDPGILRV